MLCQPTSPSTTVSARQGGWQFFSDLFDNALLLFFNEISPVEAMNHDDNDHLEDGELPEAGELPASAALSGPAPEYQRGSIPHGRDATRGDDSYASSRGYSGYRDGVLSLGRPRDAGKYGVGRDSMRDVSRGPGPRDRGDRPFDKYGGGHRSSDPPLRIGRRGPPLSARYGGSGGPGGPGRDEYRRDDPYRSRERDRDGGGRDGGGRDPRDNINNNNERLSQRPRFSMTSHYSKYGGDYNSMGRLERSHGSSSSMMGSPSGQRSGGGERSVAIDRSGFVSVRETPFMDREYQDRMMAGRDPPPRDRERDRERDPPPMERGTRERDRDPDRVRRRDSRAGARLPFSSSSRPHQAVTNPNLEPLPTNPPYSITATTKSEADIEAEKEAAERKKAEKEKEERMAALKRMGTLDILKGIKNLDDKKGDAQKDIEAAESELETLEASLPKLLKVVDKLSKKEPNYPMFTKDVSDEELSSDEDSSSSDDDDDDSTKKKRTSEKTKNLQKRIESTAPEQRRLLNRLGACIRDQALKDCVSDILAQNVLIVARTSGGALNGIVPPTLPHPATPPLQIKSRPSTNTKFWHLGYDPSLSDEEVKVRLQAAFNSRTTEATMSSVKNVLAKDLRRTLSSHVMSAIKYRIAFEAHTRARLEMEREQLQALAKEEQEKFSNFNATNPLASPTRGDRGDRGGRGVVRSDLEERIAIATLQAVEAVKSMTKLPTQLVATERTSRWVKDYRDWNRLVSDPKLAFDMDCVIRPWSQREKDVFAEKFLLYHKDFARIGKFLPNRTVPEIVKYFYSVQRSEEFEITRRKWQLRKRREKGGGIEGGGNEGGAVSGGGGGRTASGRTDVSGSRHPYSNNLEVEQEDADAESVELRRILRDARAASKKRGIVRDRSVGVRVGWSQGSLLTLLAGGGEDDRVFVGGYDKLIEKKLKAGKSGKRKTAKDPNKIPKKATKKAITAKDPTKKPKKPKKNPDQPTAVGRGM